MTTETEVLTLIDLPLKTMLQEGDYFPVGNSTQDYRVPSSAIAEKLGVPGMQSDIKNKADKDLSNVESVAQNSPVATKQDVTTASNAAQNALTKAEQAQSSVSNLQTQINSLNTEVSKMLGRMNFNAVVGFSLTHGQTFTVPSKGYLWISGVAGESYGGYASINGSLLLGGNNTSSRGAVFVPVSAGDVLSATRSNKNSTVTVSGFFAPQI